MTLRFSSRKLHPLYAGKLDPKKDWQGIQFDTGLQSLSWMCELLLLGGCLAGCVEPGSRSHNVRLLGDHDGFNTTARVPAAFGAQRGTVPSAQRVLPRASSGRPTDWSLELAKLPRAAVAAGRSACQSWSTVTGGWLLSW